MKIFRFLLLTIFLLLTSNSFADKTNDTVKNDKQIGVYLKTPTIRESYAYDKFFETYANTYFNGYASILKAQCGVESGFNPSAIESKYSYTVGLCQFKQSTFDFIRTKYDHWIKQNKHTVKGITDGKSSILVAALYMYDIKWDWQKYAEKNKIEIKDDDLLKLTLASYNAGIGNLIKSRKKCIKSGKSCITYNSIIAYLPKVTGKKKSNITKQYVAKILYNKNNYAYYDERVIEKLYG